MPRKIEHHTSSNGLYFVGFIGAAVWFISQADTFWTGVLGFLKAMVWPAFLVYEAFQALATG
jgi:hypothetical protein